MPFHVFRDWNPLSRCTCISMMSPSAYAAWEISYWQALARDDSEELRTICPDAR
jgi:hypothetical protein